MGTPWFKTGDKIVIFVVSVLVSVFLIWNTWGVNPDLKVYAVVARDGEVVKRIELNSINEPKYIFLNSGVNQIIVAERGRIRFLESDCPNRTCVKTGWLTKKGDKAVCIPTKTIIKVEGTSSEADTLAY